MALPKQKTEADRLSVHPGQPGDRPRDPDALLKDWRHLLQTHHHLHAPEAARMLGVAEAALVASRIGSGALRLKPDIATILAPVSAWGRVLCAFSNPLGVHMPLGVVSAHIPSEDGMFCLHGLHMQAEIAIEAVADAYLFIDHDESHGNTRSVQFHDANGAPILKVFIFHKTKFDAAQKHIMGLKADDQSRGFHLASAAPGRFDARARSLAEDPVAEWLDTADMKTLIAKSFDASLAEGSVGFGIEMVGDHARVGWSGILSSVRLDEQMFHLHEADIRSHLRYGPMVRAARTQAGALSIDGEGGRLLRIAGEENG